MSPRRRTRRTPAGKLKITQVRRSSKAKKYAFGVFRKVAVISVLGLLTGGLKSLAHTCNCGHCSDPGKCSPSDSSCECASFPYYNPCSSCGY
jgi:hypothetical protein